MKIASAPSFTAANGQLSTSNTVKLLECTNFEVTSQGLVCNRERKNVQHLALRVLSPGKERLQFRLLTLLYNLH